MRKLENDLLKNINYSTNLIFENINKIKKSNKLIGIYGKVIYAGYIVDNLRKWSIDVDYYVVDDEYYNDKMNSQIIKISELKQYNDSILIIGFETLIGKESLLKNKKAKALYYAPSIDIIEFEHCYVDYDFITYKYILDNNKAFQETYDALGDELSKRVMVEYLNTCISGRSELLGLLNQDYLHDYDYDLLYKYSKNKGKVVECGAYDGKTALELDEYLSNNDIELDILALEPDSQNYKILCEKTINNSKIIPLKYGVSSEDGVLFFDQQGGSGSTIVTENVNHDEDYVKISVKSIDSIMEEYGFIDSVLMDIEGSELETLKGAVKSIETCRPKFAVRIYHKKNDLITIPQFFINLNKKSDYKLLLRNSQSTRGHLDVTLYAI